jgi:adenosylcobyric acid synthase
MHMGVTLGAGLDRPFARIGEVADGAVSPDGTVLGTYLHGVFAADAFRRNFLGSAAATSTLNYEATVDATLDALAAHLEAHLDLDQLLGLAR